jgi:dihydrofolate reductase
MDLATKAGETELFIIGGSAIYQLGMPLAQRLYLTEIDANLEGDTYFPEFDRQNWKEISRKHHSVDDRHAYAFDFVIYERIK